MRRREFDSIVRIVRMEYELYCLATPPFTIFALSTTIPSSLNERS
jgi:hypothetical protein